MRLSVVIPARNEEAVIADTVYSISHALDSAAIDHEIVVVDDGSIDSTFSKLESLRASVPVLKPVKNEGKHGFGCAVRKGIESVKGDAVAIMMADMSDDPNDLVRFFRRMEESGADAVFGSRFIEGGRIIDYPERRLMWNRFANMLVRSLFFFKYNDITNAFKLYKMELVRRAIPLKAEGFNLTLELPLRSIVRGARFEVVPNSWTGRKRGVSKFSVRKQAPGYGKVLLAALLEKYLGIGKYR